MGDIVFLAKSVNIESGHASGKYFQRIEVIEWIFAVLLLLQLLLLHFYVPALMIQF
jgi:hypothetical protein